MPPSDRFPHLLLPRPAEPDSFKPKGGGTKRKIPSLDREEHGTRLRDQLVQAQKDALARRQSGEAEAKALGIVLSDGIYLEFDIAVGQQQSLKSLESERMRGIELCAVYEVHKPPSPPLTRATVYVPRGQLGYFENRIKRYLSEDSQFGRPKNEALVASIQDIRLATLQSLWTDAEDVLPSFGEPLWWEVWLRKNDSEMLQQFRRDAEKLQLRVDEASLMFPDRRVVLVHGTREQLTRSVEILDSIAELRKAKELASSFTEMSSVEQSEWRTDLLRRLQPPPGNAPTVCLLDTGVNRQHPLIEFALAESDLQGYDPTWSTTDHVGHGTEMAGIALYGDLRAALASRSTVVLSHCLESVKILPPSGRNDPQLYGVITLGSIGKAEQRAPRRPRVVCLTVTTTDFRDRGQPSSWSAEIDQICSGAQDERRRLVIISAGNTDLAQRANYPASNQTDGIHDPGQSWNALTVGAHTDRVRMDGVGYRGWIPIAEGGALSPSSTTSCIWNRKWPIKPDIVMEGGNMARVPDGTVDYVDSLQLLTTNWRPMDKSFVVTGDTSAAAAQAARLAAIVQAQYPNYWPETIRALLVHSAEWTPAMKAQCPGDGKKDKDAQGIGWRLSHYGFGVPTIEKALFCARNLLTLIAQDSLQPFERKVDGAFRSKEMKLHKLPWPKAELLKLGEVRVELRVTLSYFIEPSPGRRGWNDRHRYASHGLRFGMQNPHESVSDFRRRINAAAQAEDGSEATSRTDSLDWMFGPNLRHRGSLHADRWEGTAADLALCENIAIYPVIGWWREREHLARGDRRARYALVVSIQSPSEAVDIYTPVAQQIQTFVTATVET